LYYDSVSGVLAIPSLRSLEGTCLVACVSEFGLEFTWKFDM